MKSDGRQGRGVVVSHAFNGLPKVVEDGEPVH